MSGSTFEVPLPAEQVMPVVEDHLDRFGGVLVAAWEAFATARSRSIEQMAYAGAGARGMLVSDFTREPAHRFFGPAPGVRVDDRFGRPWVNLDGGNVQVRFRKFTSALSLCRNDSDRATRLAFHLGDMLFPDLPDATILTAGYVLDASETHLERLALVCHIGGHVHYVIPLPGLAGAGTVPTQLPLTSLSAPIIRSARAAAAQRLSGQATGSD
jgi:hypothetical protein